MARLFASSIQEPEYKRISVRRSLWFALMAAFMIGAEMVRIIGLATNGNHQDYLAFEVASLVVWLAIGLRWGRGVWELTKPPSSVKEAVSAASETDEPPVHES